MVLNLLVCSSFIIELSCLVEVWHRLHTIKSSSRIVLEDAKCYFLNHVFNALTLLKIRGKPITVIYLFIFSDSEVLVPNPTRILNLEYVEFEITSNLKEFHKSLAALHNDDWVFPT